jgi:hypothetical protein
LEPTCSLPLSHTTFRVRLGIVQKTALPSPD